jgi:predicted dehydrogenase
LKRLDKSARKQLDAKQQMPEALVPQIAVIGCGYWGKNLVRNFNRLGALALICEPNASGQERAKELAPEVRIATNLQEALDSDVAGVVIATPAETHYEIAKRALLACKDVFVEKPLALSYDAGIELVQAAEAANAILMVGHVLEYHPAIARLLELVQTGELGTVRYISSNRLNLGKVRREENILWSFAPHDIAVILRLAGQLPHEVAAHGGSYIQQNIADVTTTHMRFDNGVRAHIYVSWLHPFKEQRLVVIGSRKMASFDDVTKRLVLYDQRVELHEGEPVPIKGNGDEVPFPADEPLALECRAFLDAIRTRRKPLTDGCSGLQVLQVLQAAEQSLAANGEVIILPGKDLRAMKGKATSTK